MFPFKDLKKYFSFLKSRKEKVTEPGLTLVGVGPGDPSLLTFAAVSAIQGASLVAYPVAKMGSEGMAQKIASEFLKGKKCMPILFPMITEIDALKDAWEEGSSKLVEAVRSGENVVLLCQGDPSLYATSSYILLQISMNYPMCPLKVIPGISSFNAAAAIAKVPLSLQNEELSVSCVPDDHEALEIMLDDFMSSRKVLVLLKLGKRWKWVRSILEEKKLLGNTLFVQRVGFPDQLIVQATDMPGHNVPYFSLLIIRKRPTLFD